MDDPKKYEVTSLASAAQAGLAVAVIGQQSSSLCSLGVVERHRDLEESSALAQELQDALRQRRRLLGGETQCVLL